MAITLTPRKNKKDALADSTCTSRPHPNIPNDESVINTAVYDTPREAASVDSREECACADTTPPLASLLLA